MVLNLVGTINSRYQGTQFIDTAVLESTCTSTFSSTFPGTKFSTCGAAVAPWAKTSSWKKSHPAGSRTAKSSAASAVAAWHSNGHGMAGAQAQAELDPTMETEKQVHYRSEAARAAE